MTEAFISALCLNVVLAFAFLFALYWVIKWAVSAGIEDAHARRRARLDDERERRLAADPMSGLE